MDRHFLFLLLAIVILIPNTTAHRSVVDPINNVENDPSVQIEDLPYYSSAPEEPEPFFNPGHHNLYGYGNMMMQPPRNSYRHPFNPGFQHPMYMNIPQEIQPKWRTAYPRQVPRSMAYWISKKKRNRIPKQPYFIPHEEHTTAKALDATQTTAAAITSAATTATTEAATTIAATTLAATTVAATTAAATTSSTTTTTTTTTTPEPIPETTTQVVEIETTEAPKQQSEEAGEDPKQRQLSTSKPGNDCAPNEKLAKSHVIAGYEEPAAAIVNTPISSTEAAASSTEDPSPILEVAPLASYRRNKTPLLTEMALPPMYADKSLYAPDYPSMPYLPTMPINPYAYRRLGVPPIYPSIPERYYGY